MIDVYNTFTKFSWTEKIPKFVLLNGLLNIKILF